jgi:hypothetical protein
MSRGVRLLVVDGTGIVETDPRMLRDGNTRSPR